MKRLMLIWVLFLAACGEIGILISPALAHGVSSGSTGGGMVLLVFPAAAILFALVFVFTHGKKGWTVLVTGGAGYVGSALVPELLRRGHRVVVLDPYPHGEDVFNEFHGYQDLREVKGDIGDQHTLEEALRGCDAVIHLASIANTSSHDPDPGLGEPVNADGFQPIVRAAKNAGVKRFIYASSFRVYGIKDGVEATEDLPLEPVDAVSRRKALCEKTLEEERAPGFVTCTVRPSIVCGYAPSQRFDDIVNTLTNDAVNAGHIRVFGGSQKRPFIHVDDMVAFYLFLLDQPDARIDGMTFNAGSENLTLLELADIVKNAVGGDVSIDVEPTDGLCSHQVSSVRMRRELGFEPSHSVEDAVRDLAVLKR